MRVRHDISTSIATESSAYGWDKAELIENGVAKYIRTHWNPEYQWRSLVQNSVSTELYLSKGGLPTWDMSVATDLMSNYPVESVTESLVLEVIELAKIERFK